MVANKNCPICNAVLADLYYWYESNKLPRTFCCSEDCLKKLLVEQGHS